jgi:hypothetical protein
MAIEPYNEMYDIEIRRSFKCNYSIDIINNVKFEYISDYDISTIKNKYIKTYQNNPFCPTTFLTTCMSSSHRGLSF